jgi:hypothetical protein
VLKGKGTQIRGLSHSILLEGKGTQIRGLSHSIVFCRDFGGVENTIRSLTSLGFLKTKQSKNRGNVESCKGSPV